MTTNFLTLAIIVITLPTLAAETPKQRADRLTEEHLQADRYAQFIPRDPWRQIAGTKQYAKGTNWVQFYGKVLGVHPDGIRLRGWYGRPGSSAGAADPSGEFFVAGFPHQVIDDQVLTSGLNLTARHAGIKTYSTVLGGVRTMRQLEYGKPIPIPAAAPARSPGAASAKTTHSTPSVQTHSNDSPRKIPSGPP